MDELKRNGIVDKATYHQWIIKNHPDRGGNTQKFIRILKLYKGQPVESIKPVITKQKTKSVYIPKPKYSIPKFTNTPEGREMIKEYMKRKELGLDVSRYFYLFV